MPRPQSFVKSECSTVASSSGRTRSSSEDGAYSSTSEAELDSDHELDLDAEVDPQKLLGAWLGELDAINLQQLVSAAQHVGVHALGHSR
ncbi:hypothetical protein HPB49_003297 [Dermacentor silvarum]|uniref:Uncharacterized protein n=1 Tax=Dermacentor silvarum TaxID=543639 RepID=A0ACB8DAQ4_DERSI|nr:hypothetical protein HPB49_003297 [Dermacentor silvarum]